VLILLILAVFMCRTVAYTTLNKLFAVFKNTLSALVYSLIITLAACARMYTGWRFGERDKVSKLMSSVLALL